MSSITRIFGDEVTPERIIGETLFPEGIYNSYVFLVAEEGLYISRDYQMLTGNSEDTITFERFELKKQ